MYDVHVERHSAGEHRFQGLYEGNSGYSIGFVIYMRGGYRYSTLTDASDVVTHTTTFDMTTTKFALKNQGGTDVSGTSLNITQLVNIAGANGEQRWMSGAVNITGNVDIGGGVHSQGVIVQVEQAVKTNTSAVTSTSVVDIGYLSVDITPKFSTSKILVSYIVNVGVDITGTVNMHGFLRVKRTQGGISTYIGDGASSGNRQVCTSYIYNTLMGQLESFSFEHLDDANGTGTVTYTIQGLVEASVYTMTINRAGGDGNNGYYGRTTSSITAKEVCQ
jgi:hypothetical protein